MKDFLKVAGLLVLIGGSLVAIFWNKGYYGLLPTQKGESCSGVVASSYVVSNNFASGQISLNLFDRIFIYSVDNSISRSYCVGYVAPHGN